MKSWWIHKNPLKSQICAHFFYKLFELVKFSASYHDEFAVLDFSDMLGLFAVPLLDVDQLVSFQSHGGLKGQKVLNLGVNFQWI